MKPIRHLVAAATLLSLPLSGIAAPVSVTLEPMEHMQAELVVARPDGSEMSYTPAALEEFPTYRLRTTTPWRAEPAEFDGVMLRDILAANGLEGVDAILVTAENDFTATLPRALWETVDVVVVTRVDGRPHSRRARGPIQFVIDMDAYEASDVALEDHLVWMAARIEAIR